MKEEDKIEKMKKEARDVCFRDEPRGDIITI